MANWCIQHPWMTFFIIILMLESSRTVIKYITGWHSSDKEIELEILKESKE